MPTVRIFGQEVERKQLLIGGGLVAAAVAVVVFLRARAASAAAASAQAPQPQPQDQAGAGAGMTVGAPTGQIADQYQQQMDNSQLEAQKIANDYQRNLVGQQQRQFDFQQKLSEQLAPQLQAAQGAELQAQTNYYKRVAATRVSCPGGQGVAKDVDGNLYCRQKTSGGILGIPVGDFARTVQNFVGGVEAAAPEIGYTSAKQAAAYYTGQYFPATGQRPAKKEKLPTPPIAPTPAHGYGEIHL